MPDKSRKEQILAMLAEDDGDPFLRYALAMEYASEGDDEGAVRQFRLTAAATPDYVAAYQQAGQALARLGRPGEAAEEFRRGIAVAQRVGNLHAAEEMRAFLADLT